MGPPAPKRKMTKAEKEAADKKKWEAAQEEEKRQKALEVTPTVCLAAHEPFASLPPRACMRLCVLAWGKFVRASCLPGMPQLHAAMVHYDTASPLPSQPAHAGQRDDCAPTLAGVSHVHWQEAGKQGCEPITGMSAGQPWSSEEIQLVYKIEGGGYEIMERRRILLVSHVTLRHALCYHELAAVIDQQVCTCACPFGLATGMLL